MEERVPFEVRGRTLQLRNLDKVLFPASGLTKAHVINYYIRMAPFILPHLRERPLTLKLYPDGVLSQPRFLKNAPRYTPSWIKRFPIWRKSGRSQIHFVLVNDLPSLVWAAGISDIEMHVFLARAPKIERPTAVLFDLDPGEPASLLECARVALWLKAALEELKLKAFIKSSGGKGLHVYVPLNTPATYQQTQGFARSLAEVLETAHPELVVSRMAKQLRAGKVFIDYSQNASYKSTVCVYSLRAKREGPNVSMPLRWEQLAEAVRDGGTPDFSVGLQTAIDRCEKTGDLFAPVLRLKQKLPARIGPAVAKVPLPPAGASRVRSSPQGKLRKYHAKRDFSRTREPAGAAGRAAPKRPESNGGSAHAPLFVIQKHAASHLHYDFRLQMEGVLRSWAVPKGPPLNRGERRLAMHVEDHPLDYARFEGTIPAGQYGGGTVMVWDLGHYRVKDEHPVRAFHRGKLHLQLAGKKLKGEWALVRARGGENRGKDPWFLIKIDANSRPISRRRDDESVLTGRTMEQIRRDNVAQWRSNRA